MGWERAAGNIPNDGSEQHRSRLFQQYFYEYSFDELRQRPRQVCPYAVVSFQFKGKDSPLPSTPLAPSRYVTPHVIPVEHPQRVSRSPEAYVEHDGNDELIMEMWEVVNVLFHVFFMSFFLHVFSLWSLDEVRMVSASSNFISP